MDSMRLTEIVARTPRPAPWAEGEKIPWNEPAFSGRMLAEHLSQAHDLASRRTGRIDEQVRWIHRNLLAERPTRVLDLCCGPGLYAQRLAALGHTCVGIDFGPASIAYARQQAAEGGADCTFIEGDVRTAAFGGGFGLAMLIFGEFNVFRPAEAEEILRRAAAALVPGGWIVLEPQTDEVVRATGRRGPSWSASGGGLFSERPHLCLEENAWDEQLRVATTRYYIIDAATAAVTRHAASVQAYEPEQLEALLTRHGFGDVSVLRAPGGEDLQVQEGLLWLSARKRND